MRRGIFVALTLIASCGGSGDDPCEGKSGSCLALHVVGSGAITQIDQIDVHLSGAVSFEGRDPPAPGPALDLPVHAALILKDGQGDTIVAVTGFLANTTVGAGASTVKVTPGQHESVTVTLAAPMMIADGGAHDQSMPLDANLVDAAPPIDQARTYDFAFDGGSNDFSMPDFAVADLAVADLAVADLAVADLATRDLTVPPDLTPLPDLAPPPRLIFLLSARTSNLGGVAGADTSCTAAANQAGHPGTFRAVLSGNQGAGQDAVARIQLGQGRPIVLVDNTQVATDATLWNQGVTAPVQLLIDGSKFTATCAWTGTQPNGGATGNDCQNWGGFPLGSGTNGQVKQVGPAWINAGTTACTNTCHVYCIEQ